jgi:hypothetical protein
LGACHDAAAPPPAEPLEYVGVTCGPAIPPPVHTEPALPLRIEVPAFVAPRAMPSIESRGGLTSDVVNRPMLARMPVLRACYLHLVAQNPNAGGFRVRTHFTIVEDGSIAGIEVDGIDPTMDHCLCNALAATTFPRLDARALVTYPLIFGP